MNNMPSVSIIIPVFNLEGFISETLNSVLNQSYTNFEVLVIDDNSIDNTGAIVQKYCQIDSRIKLLSNTHKKGASGARNTGIMAAKGEWVAFLDGDDIWTPDALTARLDSLLEFPDISFISGDSTCFSSDITQADVLPASSRVMAWNKYFSTGVKTGSNVYMIKPVDIFLEGSLVITSSVMMKRSLLLELGGFDESLKTAEDILLWLQAVVRTDFVFVPILVTYYRHRPESLMNSDKAIFNDAPAAYKKLLSDPLFLTYKPQIVSQIQSFMHQNCFFYRKKRYLWAAFKCSVAALFWKPLSWVSWKNFMACCLLR